MDPGTGRLYQILDAAHLAGVFNAVQLIGRHEDIQQVSTAVASTWTRKQKAARNTKNKAARAARRNNR